MKSIKKVEVLTVGKILGLVTGGVYLIVVILIVTLGTLIFDSSDFSRLDVLGFGSTVMATFLFALLIGVVNFIIGIVIGWLYNLTASLVGGIHVELEEVEDHHQLFEKRLKRAKFKKAKKDQKDESVIGSRRPQSEINQIMEDGFIKEEKRDTFKIGED